MFADERVVLESILRFNRLGFDNESTGLKALKRETNFQIDFFLPISEKTEAELVAFFSDFQKDLKNIFRSGFDSSLERISEFLRVPEIIDKRFAGHFDLEQEQSISRPDFFWAKDGLRMIEQNISSAVGGMSQVLKMLQCASTMDKLKRLVDDQSILVRDPVLAMAHSLKNSGVETLFALDVELVRGAYWDDTLLLLRDSFAKVGISLVELFTELIETDGAHLTVASRPVRDILRLAVASNVFDRNTDLSELLRCPGIKWHGNLNEIIYWNKLWLAFFSDEKLRQEFGVELRRDYSNWIPWSRIVRESVTQFRDRTVSLMDLLMNEKDLFVIKRGNGWLTKAVFFGSQFTKSGWRKFLINAVAEGDWMVQEFLHGIEIEAQAAGSRVRCNLIVSPYFIENKIEGYMVRTPGHHMTESRDAFNGLTTAITYRSSVDLL